MDATIVWQNNGGRRRRSSRKIKRICKKKMKVRRGEKEKGREKRRI